MAKKILRLCIFSIRATNINNGGAIRMDKLGFGSNDNTSAYF
ncbi:MAG: hypothetical protein Q7W13_00935 [Bacteroidia bacterium]|nr:hypothetical protein [Bacteroidia bacterium]